MSSEEKFIPKKFSQTDDQEDEGTLILQNLVRRNGAIKLRLGGNDKTPNYDGLIELRNDTHVVGKLEVQVRPVDPQRRDRPCYQVDANLVGYSKISGLPFVLICYDRNNDKAYWKKIDDSLFQGAKEKQKSITVNFDPQDEIAEGFPYSDSWFKISKEHLEIHNQVDQFRRAIAVVKSTGGSDAFAGLLESPEALSKLLQQLIETSLEKFKARLEEARRLLSEHEIIGATKIVSQLEEELCRNGSEKDLLVSVRNCLGNCYIRLEKFEKAENIFRAAVADDEASWKAQCNLAHSLYIRNNRNNRRDALERAEMAYQAQPDNEFAVSVYILCLSFNDELTTLDKLLTERAYLIDNSSEIQMALAQTCKERQNYEQALECFERARKLEPQNAHIELLLAETTYKAIRARALSSISQGVEPNSQEVVTTVDATIKGLDNALQTLSKTSDRQAHYRAFELRALLNITKADLKAAKVDCDKMSAVLPSAESWKIIKAQALTQANEFADAEDLLDPLAASGRKDVLQILAYINHRVGNHTKAAKYFTSYIEETDSDQEWIAYTLSLWLAGEKKKAYQSAHSLRKTGRAPIIIMRGVELKRLLEMQEWIAALDVLEDLVKAEPGNAEHLLNRVAMNINLNRKERAVELHRGLPLELIESDGWARSTLAQIELDLRNRRWIL